MKKISVIMASYNGEKYIKEQILSILNQNYRIKELIIGDDGSKDKTIQIIEELILKYSNIKLIKNKKNMGVSKNFMNLLKIATGDIIFFSDQDDIWYENKISKMIEKIVDKEQKILIYSNNDVVDKNLNILTKNMQFEFRKSNILENLLFYNGGIQGCSMAITKSLKAEIIKYKKYIYMHDLIITLFASLYADEIIYIKEALFSYRQHDSNIIGFKKNLKGRLKKILKFKYFLINQEVYKTISEFFLFKRKKLKLDEKNKIDLFEKICNEKSYIKRNYFIIKSNFKFRNSKIKLLTKSCVSLNIIKLWKKG